MTNQIILIPIIAALIGWVTNYIAVKMLFRPHKPYLGGLIQGLVPKRQAEIAKNIGETVQRELLTHEDILAILRSPDIERALVAQVEGQVEHFLNKLKQENPMIAMFIQGDIGSRVRSMLIDQLKEAAPELIEGVMSEVEKKMNFQELVTKRIEGFDLTTLEGIIQRISARELRAIELLGGVLGFMVGLVQVVVIQLS